MSRPASVVTGLVTSHAGAVLDFALFQLAWFTCVTQAARGGPALGIAAVAVFVLVQLARSTHRTADTALIVLALALGAAWDTCMMQLDVVRYAAQGPVAWLAPAWILALWALFAAVLRGPLAWLKGRRALAAALGAVGGPASYAAAARMGACTLPDPVSAFVLLAAGWAVFTPLLVEAAGRLEARGIRLAAAR